MYGLDASDLNPNNVQFDEFDLNPPLLFIPGSDLSVDAEDGPDHRKMSSITGNRTEDGKRKRKETEQRRRANFANRACCKFFKFYKNGCPLTF
jgi:hypothetical protein